MTQDNGNQQYQMPPQPVLTPEPPGGPGPSAQMKADLEALNKSVASGANWFYWIAGLSAVNTAAFLLHLNFRFVIGLGATALLEELVGQVGSVMAIVAVPIGIGIIGVYAALGYFSVRRMRWAFGVGIALYALDTLLILAVKEWFSLAFHVFALFCIINGLLACNKALALERQMKVAERYTGQTPGNPG